MRLSEFGQIVAARWMAIPTLYPQTRLDSYVIMPNHLHGIIVIHQSGSNVGVGAIYMSPSNTANPEQLPAHPAGPTRGSLGVIIGTFKAAATRAINRLPDPPDSPLWQRNYYEHVVRNERDLARIRAYIAENPTRWQWDRDNPVNW
jgi:putative transposase